MNKKEIKLVYILLIIIIISSIILIYKINSKPEYDEKIYEEVYAEYNEIINEEKRTKSNSVNSEVTTRIYQNGSGVSYSVIATIKIPKISLYLPIISTTSDEYLKIAPTKLFGPEPNHIGNFCVVGHNFKDDKHFSNLSKLEIGDIVELGDVRNDTMKYKVYDKYEVYETDLSPTNQNTNGNIELTLITCTKNKNKRLVVKCRINEM